MSVAGSVDWACLTRFDRSSAFGRILDWEHGGHFAIAPVTPAEVERRYRGDSLVLETTFATDAGEARVVDAFAMRRGGTRAPRNQLLRVVEGVRGRVAFDVVFRPRFDYGTLRPWLRYHEHTRAWTAVGGHSALKLTAPCSLRLDGVDKAIVGRLEVDAGERVGFSVIATTPHDNDRTAEPADEILAHLDETQAWWDAWARGIVATGPYAGAVRRSATVLKGLTCAPTGAMVAAPTTSLPEEVGGERNWDYRYTWVRDSTMAIAALSLVGHDEVARGYRDFLLRTAAGTADDLQIMYGITGQRHLPEVELDLDGYRGSRPVRIGNGAARQVQLDVYGHIVDAAQLWQEAHAPPDEEEWRFLRQVVDAAIARWRDPDHGIWEIRGAPRQLVHSKVMAWVAVDRGLRLARELGDLDGDVARWEEVAAEIRAEVGAHGVHPEEGHYVQAYASREVDAALLLLPTLGWCSPEDPRWRGTVAAVERNLVVDGYVRRYRTETGHDALRGDEGAFLMCTFWLVDALILTGRVDEARARFEELLDCANDVGLLSEEIDPTTGELLGNFPQAFTHLALITTAHALTRAVEGRDAHDPVRTGARLRRGW